MVLEKEIIAGSLRMGTAPSCCAVTGDEYITCRIRKATKARVLEVGKGVWGESFADVLDRVIGGQDA